MTALPSVEPLPPGARPTEPGWYVASSTKEATEPFIVHLLVLGYDDEPEAVVYYAGNDCSWPLDGEVEKHGLAFIARIYPDRIGQE